MQDSAAEGPHPWSQDLDPLLRPQVLEKIVRTLAQVYHGQFDSTEDLNRVASRFENKVFHEANSKGDYLRRVSYRLVTLELKQKQKLLQHAASIHHHQVQMGSHMHPVNSVHAIHGGSDLVPNQNVAYPLAPNMHVKVKQEHIEVTGKTGQTLNSPQASTTPSAPSVQLSQQMVQPVATQKSKQLALQMQPSDFSGCNPTSITQPQGQPLVQPNVQQNPLRKNGMLPKELMMVNQKGLGFNQQQMNRQKYQMRVAQHASITKMHNGHPGARNSQPGATVGLRSTSRTHEQEALNEQIEMEPQPMALPQQLITATTMGSAGEVDWREKMFQKIKPLKDAYLSELMELDKAILVPKLSQRQFESLPNDRVQQYRYRVHLKQKTKLMVKFLLLEKSSIPDNYRVQLSTFVKSIQDLIGFYRKSKNLTMDARNKSQISHGQPKIINLIGDQAPSSGSTSHQNRQEKLVKSQLTKDIITTTPAAHQEINSNSLVGVESSCFPEKTRGSLQSLAIDKLQECCTQTLSHVIKSGIVKVSSPSASLVSTSPSPFSTPSGAKATASSSVSVKSTLSSPVAKPSVVKVASSCASVNSTLPSCFAESASIQAVSPCASAKSTLLPSSPVAKSGVIETTSSVTNSGCDPVALPCPSVHPTSSDNFERFYALLLQDISDTTSAQTVVGGTETNAETCFKQVPTIKPIMPASPLLAETVDHQAEDNEHPRNEIPVAKKPIDRLLDAVGTSSPAMLRSAANSVCSVLNMNDWVQQSEMDTFQDWAFLSEQCASSTANKMKRVLESTSLYSESAPFDCTGSKAEYSAERGPRRQKIQNAKDTLLDEISSANSMLLDTFISIAGDNGTDGISSSSGGTLIKLSYTATSLAPDLVSLFATPGMCIVMPVRLLVPADYPRSSPMLVCDQGDEQMRKRFSDISGTVDVAFRQALYGLPEPMSILDIARAWDASVRRAVVEFAQRHGGGTFSSSYGEWRGDAEGQVERRVEERGSGLQIRRRVEAGHGSDGDGVLDGVERAEDPLATVALEVHAANDDMDDGDEADE
ncbi:hypothetical protein C2845_PM15G00880 [Panicum miliaceum]|uniref:Uncharacterized protein n=1 Tax=Panicum miliaceum TaxID=4540 RepID=A0A3L6QD69_PANMI|nr:hypothetical protein C2845_PM15G00880 [Panicum miliaceum]